MLTDQYTIKAQIKYSESSNLIFNLLESYSLYSVHKKVCEYINNSKTITLNKFFGLFKRAHDWVVCLSILKFHTINKCLCKKKKRKIWERYIRINLSAAIMMFLWNKHKIIRSYDCRDENFLCKNASGKQISSLMIFTHFQLRNPKSLHYLLY